MPGRTPMRSCVGCMKQKEKAELIRVIRTKDGAVQLDATGRANGRGAYICPNDECLNKAVKKGTLSRTLKTQIPDSVYEELRKHLSRDTKNEREASALEQEAP